MTTWINGTAAWTPDEVGTPMHDEYAARYAAACAAFDTAPVDPEPPGAEPARQVLQVGAPGELHGIDTSSWQKLPDWSRVAAGGYGFVYIKASQGKNPSYPTLDEQYAGARAAGLDVGLYHYANPAYSPEANADAFSAQLNRLDARAGHLRPCLDLETGSGNLASWAKAFFARLRWRTGIRRMCLYSGAAFFVSHIGEGWMDDDISLWIAHYGQPPGRPRYLTPRVLIHQYSSTGTVPGVVGSTDLNIALAPLADLLTDDPNDLEEDVAASPLLLPAGTAVRTVIPVPPFDGAASLYLSTGWQAAEVHYLYFVRDEGPGLTADQEHWGGTGNFTLVPDDRPSWALPQGCTQVSIEYDAAYPIASLIVYKPTPL